MGHTNSTANLALPQFIGTDKPTWLGDVNGAFAAIDSKVGSIDADVAATGAKADTAISDASAAITTATNANNTAGTASTTATQANNIANNALTVANNADGHTNQLEMKVGLLADLHTTDKDSIVDAINEVKDAEGDLANLTTTDKTSLVSAINEVAQGGGGGGKTLKRTVNTDGTSTYAQIFNQFATDLEDITDDAYIVYDTVTSKLIYRVSRILSTQADFYYVYMDTTDIDMNCIQISANSKYSMSHNGVVTDASTQTPTAGRSYSLYV